MAALLITHDLKTLFKDYEPFYNEIKKNSNGWWHFFDNTWIVDTALTPSQYAEKLFPHMTQDDRIIIIRVHKGYQGWLPKEAWDWLNARYF